MLKDDRLFCLYKIEDLKRNPRHEEWIGKNGHIIGCFHCGAPLEFLLDDTNELIVTSTIIDLCITTTGYMIETEHSCYYISEVRDEEV